MVFQIKPELMYLLLVLRCLGFSMQYNFRDVLFALFNLPKYIQNIRHPEKNIKYQTS